MTTRYLITRIALRKQPEIDIAEEEYSRILVASNGVFESLHIEEKFSIVIEDY
jgi:hypothetical protein